MSVARHPRPPELEGVSAADIVNDYVARFSERRADWEAFEDAKIEEISADDFNKKFAEAE